MNMVMMGIKLRHLFISICLFSGCSKHPLPQVIMPSNIKLHAGDVVFRRGNGTISRSITYVDNNGKYSHVGIVVDSAGTFMIVHAVPNEPDYKGDVDRVKMDSPQQFFSCSKASIGEICRIEDSIIARKASLVAMNLYKRNTLFDHDYNVKDTTKMYCTELVMYAFRQAGLNLIEGEGQSVNLPFLHTTCYFPSDVYYSNSLNSIVKF